ncbi:MAG TPA: hypothetical protein VFW33_16195 [Gemmataceae bacterium]|nr:hypothetical protein [Gemmataceae bacterium]
MPHHRTLRPRTTQRQARPCPASPDDTITLAIRPPAVPRHMLNFSYTVDDATDAATAAPAAPTDTSISAPVAKSPFVARHSADFRSVVWNGIRYGPFTPTQAAVIAILWEAFENDTPDVGSGYVMERAGSDRSDQRVASVFGVTAEGQRFWSEVVTSKARGSYRLRQAGD